MLSRVRSLPGRAALPGTRARSVGGGIQSGDFITNFTTAENPMVLGGIVDTGLAVGEDWTDPLVISTGAIGRTPTPNRYDDSICVIKRSFRAFADNQFAQFTAYVAPGYVGNAGKHETGVWVRGAISANSASGYECSWGLNTDGTCYVFVTRWNGPEGDFTTLIDPSAAFGSYINAPPLPFNGAVFRLQIVGSTLLCTISGVPILTVTDTTFATGRNPGMDFWPVDGAIAANYGMAQYRAGDL